MDVVEAVKKLEKDKIHVSWKKKHSKAYLAHCFRMNDNANMNTWQIGYYNPESNLITVFVVGDAITQNPDAEVFKEQEKLVNKLDLTDVKIDDEKAMVAGTTVVKENYKGTDVFKSFMILQNLEDAGIVWNITFVTQRFTTVNVKINAKTGECVSHKSISLISDTKK